VGTKVHVCWLLCQKKYCHQLLVNPGNSANANPARCFLRMRLRVVAGKTRFKKSQDWGSAKFKRLVLPAKFVFPLLAFSLDL